MADSVAGTSFFGCVYCHEAFPEKKHLEVHQKMVHAGKPFEWKAAPVPERILKKNPTSAISKNLPLSEVNRHCVPEDCWVAIDGKVYDLTEFADRHPGGPSVIMAQAGKDATKIFNDIHKGVMINNYLRAEANVGDLGLDEELMSETFWHTLRLARIEELKEEMKQFRANKLPRKSLSRRSTADLLKSDIDPAIKKKLQTLETQKRAALDAEMFDRAQAIKAEADKLLSEAMMMESPKKDEAGGIPLSEVARHNKPHDCWVAMNGIVYDLTEAITHHPDQRKNVLAWAGRDATPMWNKIPGRFPSDKWMDFNVRPEAKIGEVGKEPPMDEDEKKLRVLEDELHRLEGPSEEEIQAAKAPKMVPKEASELDEDARFPKLREIAGDRRLQFFTRAEVAMHKGPAGGPAGTEPYIIIHNKVYDLTKLLGSHPGGDDVLLARAGTDSTKDFETFEHSEKSRIRRDQDLLIGQLVSAEHTNWGAEATKTAAGPGGAEKGFELKLYLKAKVLDLCIAALVLYAKWSWEKRKPLPKLMYSRLLRHFHFIMAVGIFGALGSVKAASMSEGLAKKRWLQIHKQTGFAMFIALIGRFFARMQSGIPPRFPSHPIMMKIETQSLRMFYLTMLVLPVSGMASEYLLKYAGGDERDNEAKAKQSMDLHVRVGNMFQKVWLPFHLGYTSLYHYSKGRGVVRKVSPWI